MRNHTLKLPALLSLVLALAFSRLACRRPGRNTQTMATWRRSPITGRTLEPHRRLGLIQSRRHRRLGGRSHQSPDDDWRQAVVR